jgi:hypothetical protein
MVIKYNNIFYSKALQILPKLGYLVWKQTIWQPWFSVFCRWTGSLTLPMKILKRKVNFLTYLRLIRFWKDHSILAAKNSKFNCWQDCQICMPKKSQFLQIIKTRKWRFGHVWWTFGICKADMWIVFHIWYICGHTVCIFPFWYAVPRKIWQPTLEAYFDNLGSCLITFIPCWQGKSENTADFK